MDKSLLINLCFSMGMLCWCAGAVAALLRRRNIKSVIRWLGVGVFASMFFFVYPFAVVQSPAFAIPVALLQVMGSAVVASDPLAIFEILSTEYTISFLGLYQAVLILEYVVAPLFTIGITLSFFESRFAPLYYRVRACRRDSHIFSQINERTLCLAESIYAADKKSVLVFIGDSQQVEEQREYAERIRKVYGHILDADPCQVKHNLKKIRTYYLLGHDSDRNLKDAIALYEKYDKIGGEMVKIWLYAKDDVASVIFDNLDEKVDIRLINEEQLIAMGLMQQYPLYQGVRDHKLVCLFVGGGHIGSEILRTALWCAQLSPKIHTEFHVIDRDGELSRGKLEQQCPGLIEEYGIRFYSADAETAEFQKILQQIQPTYIAVAMGQEQVSLRTGIKLRRFYGLDEGFPRIHVLMDHIDTQTMILKKLSISQWNFDRERNAFQRQALCSFELQPFGSYAETYCSTRFSRGYYDQLAMSILAVRFGITHLSGKLDEEYLRDLLNKVEFYKDYAYAYATGVPYKLWLMGLQLVDDGEGDLSLLNQRLPTHAHRLTRQEADRWHCYMMTKGWQPMEMAQVQGKNYQDKLRKRHARLLRENEGPLAELTGRDYVQEDLSSINRLPEVLRMANILSDKAWSVREIEA